MSSDQKTAHVYVVQCRKTKLVKVGVSTAPKMRANSVGGKLIYSAVVDDAETAYRAERIAHRALAKHSAANTTNGGGDSEWFSVGIDEAVEAVSNAFRVVKAKGGSTAESDAPSSIAPMTLTEFAKALGLTYWAVNKAIKSGRIPSSAIGLDHGRKYIANPALAAKWWAESTGVSGRRSKSVEYDELPEDVLAARKLRDLKIAQLTNARIEHVRRSKPREGIVSKHIVTAALVSACRDELDSWGDRATKRKLSIALRRVQSKVKKELGVE